MIPWLLPQIGPVIIKYQWEYQWVERPQLLGRHYSTIGQPSSLLLSFLLIFHCFLQVSTSLVFLILPILWYCAFITAMFHACELPSNCFMYLSFVLLHFYPSLSPRDSNKHTLFSFLPLTMAMQVILEDNGWPKINQWVSWPHGNLTLDLPILRVLLYQCTS